MILTAERPAGSFSWGSDDSTVFHASMAVENAANAMILRIGGTEAKDHMALSALAVVLRRMRPELLKKEEYRRLIERGREIQRDIKARAS